MKKFLYLIFSICVASTSQAQSMRDIWINMPDSMTEYLTKSQRTEMADYVTMHEPLSAQNALSGSSVIDTLTTDFIQVHASASQVIQIKRLPMLGKDSVICLNRIFYGPEPESEVAFYTTHWKTVSEPNMLHRMNWKELTVCPDTMKEARYEELLKNVDPVMTYAELSPKNNDIKFALSLPLLSAEEKKKTQAILRPKTYKWSGETVKKFEF